MDEARLKQFIEQIMRITPKFYLEIPDAGEDMAGRLRAAAVELWRASQKDDSAAKARASQELEGQLLAAQTVGRLSASETEALLDELHALAG